MKNETRRPGEPDPTSEEPGQWPTGRLLFTVARRIEQDWNAHLATWDLNHAGHPVLLHLLAGPLTQREIASRNGVTEQTMSRIVARLERSGYVVRADDPRDRRRRAVTITDTGRRVALEAAQFQPAEDLTSRGLDEEQVATLREILVDMVRAQRAEPGTSVGQ
ncbi:MULTISPECIES: MarR family winged helix-turn-helix transcriptional regulator [Isoptericola]|uniref:Winged helix-turn-helix transcriptional regulator n=1 Tax=Isoptericola sediminis TaxID=2733572 RepID=A0A849K197_9MICO|nr:MULTISPECIES: MarR family winged helix-turn-helix transcriptional regulator [unclassified Isoptericola]MDO8145240.1 MarR family winged helix-turn-helix transcriptional regulator [Isoptericola sp. 178]MDO8148878.1 MarR family winged helix-turn-helix transcriptional regulator [Isoptericola sp. b515]MDO8151180.1 MarR family winged helix-turn-helix transcriptional regulator [Isoptericola sp. b408]NNU28524.1 winged helix-turn-helix transcriptional regulator [Isoptericola sediminis]